MENPRVFSATVIPFPTVVRPPDFYYHLTTIDGIDLPHLAVFCFFRYRVTESRLATKPARHSASCRVPFFIVEKSVVMVYNKLLNFSGVTGGYDKSGFAEIRL